MRHQPLSSDSMSGSRLRCSARSGDLRRSPRATKCCSSERGTARSSRPGWSRAPARMLRSNSRIRCESASATSRRCTSIGATSSSRRSWLTCVASPRRWIRSSDRRLAAWRLAFSRGESPDFRGRPRSRDGPSRSSSSSIARSQRLRSLAQGRGHARCAPTARFTSDPRAGCQEMSQIASRPGCTSTPSTESTFSFNSSATSQMTKPRRQQRKSRRRIGESKRADLLKMHAYRDAIRRTAGAYVLFPGTKAGRFTLDTETLPGIGAFPMRPASDGGPASGRQALTSFLGEVLSHVANQATRHERSRFWTERIAAEGNLAVSPDPPMDSLDFPPADTGVLLVRMSRRAELDWLMTSRTCVLPDRDPGSSRPFEPSLSANFLLLHGPGVENQMLVRRVSDWYPMDRTQLEGAGAPGPNSGAALCCRVAPVEDAPWWITAVDVESLLDEGARSLVSWLDLAGAVPIE